MHNARQQQRQSQIESSTASCQQRHVCLRPHNQHDIKLPGAIAGTAVASLASTLASSSVSRRRSIASAPAAPTILVSSNISDCNSTILNLKYRGGGLAVHPIQGFWDNKKLDKILLFQVLDDKIAILEILWKLLMHAKSASMCCKLHFDSPQSLHTVRCTYR